MRRPSMTNEDELRWSEHSHSEKFGHRRKQLGSAAGGERLGCSLYEMTPGRKAWPYHYHLANEEASTSSTSRARSGSANRSSPFLGEVTWRCRWENQERTRS